MNALTIKPYTNASKMRIADFWAMLKAQAERHDEYTYTMLSTTTDFDVVYTTVYDEKRTATIYDFFVHISEQIDVDGVALVLQQYDEFYTVFVIED